MSNSEHQERKIKIFGVELSANPNSIDEDIRDVDDKKAIAPNSDEIIRMFYTPTGKKVSGVEVLREGKDFIEVECGCTNWTDQPCPRDSPGILRISAKGSPQVTCLCQPGCLHAYVSPNKFLKHAGINAGWKKRIWVLTNGCREGLHKTTLLDYYSGSAINPSSNIGRRDSVHRDGFIACSSCGKERRFKLSDPTHCRMYHELDRLRESWECIDYPFAELSCESPEERKEDRKKRGCKKHSKCRGCTACVCPGCVDCRFKKCQCSTCVDFYLSYKPQGASGSSSRSGKRKRN